MPLKYDDFNTKLQVVTVYWSWCKEALLSSWWPGSLVVMGAIQV